jgi:hypothetical protein
MDRLTLPMDRLILPMNRLIADRLITGGGVQSGDGAWVMTAGGGRF